MRFGESVFIAPGASLKNIWSIPKSRAKKYWIKVKNPVKSTTNPENWIIFCLLLLIILVCSKNKEIPIKTKQMARLDFTVEKAGPGLLNRGMLKAQPKIIINPKIAIKTLKTFE
jgi:hypothetical protein